MKTKYFFKGKERSIEVNLELESKKTNGKIRDELAWDLLREIINPLFTQRTKEVFFIREIKEIKEKVSPFEILEKEVVE